MVIDKEPSFVKNRKADSDVEDDEFEDKVKENMQEPEVTMKEPKSDAMIGKYKLSDLKRKFYSSFTDFKLSLPHGHEARKTKASTMWAVCLNQKIEPKNWKALYHKMAAEAASNAKPV